MCKEHLIARGTVHAFISQKGKFTYDEVHNEIIRRNGIMRVSMGVTVSDYLGDFEKKGIVEYEPEKGLYEVKQK